MHKSDKKALNAGFGTMPDGTFFITRRGLLVTIMFFTLLIVLALSAGFFFGSYDQIEKSKSRLEVITDVNCGNRSTPLH
jgi:hypothetical protein